MKARLLHLYRALARRFGPQAWWPGRTPYEIAAGAVLTQHTAWTNAARAVAALRARRVLSARRLARLSPAELARMIRPAGTPRVKARRLLALTRWLVGRGIGAFARMRGLPLGPLRRELLAVPGLGPETADAILLYAAGRPVFVADAYARRVLARHRLLPRGAGYEAARVSADQAPPAPRAGRARAPACLDHHRAFHRSLGGGTASTRAALPTDPPRSCSLAHRRRTAQKLRVSAG